MRSALCVVGFLSLATPTVAQVHLEVRTEKAEYVEAEPIVVVLLVKNEGTTPIGYPWDVSVSVPAARQRVLSNLFGCSGFGMSEGSASGRSSHEPVLARPSGNEDAIARYLRPPRYLIPA